MNAKQRPSVIDLTDEATVVHSVTPELQQRPTKQRRISRRIQEARASGDGDGQSSKKDTPNNKKVSSSSVDVEQQPSKSDTDVVYRKNDYYEVENILDRRTKNYGGDSVAGGRNVVEYLVRWKNPPDYTGEGSYYEDSWQVAENLDPYSLALAFRLFPMDGDADRSNNEKEEDIDSGEDELDLHLDLDDDLFEEEEDDVSEEEEEEILSGDAKDDGEYDIVEEIDVQTHRAIAHLGDSDYDSPGTVELELNRKTYRVGQSFISPNGDSFYTISTILPIQRKAKCLEYVKMDTCCFACPKGKEGTFIQLSDEVILDLSLLKTYTPSTSLHLKKFSMKYEESEKQRSFCYSNNETAKVNHHPTGKPTVLELFAGVGGMSLGLEKAGFDVKWVVDSDELAAATLTANKTNSVNVYTEKLSKFLKSCLQEDPAYPKPGEVDHIHASPPCKGFSRANRNGGRDDTVNNKQTLLSVKAIQHFKPKTVTFENVTGLLTPDFKGYLKSVVASLLTMKYQVRVDVFNASAFGDPQHRRRLFILASRHDCLLPASPLPTHGHGGNLLPIKTCRDALQMFDKEPTSSGAILLSSTNTKIWNHIAPRLAPNMKRDYELIADEPSRTVLARSRPHVHYNGSRYISVREAAALQSFPSTYRFFGSLSSQYSQVGNAVPICLATAISRSVIRVHGAP